jgi:hypothetical protein
MGAGSGPLPRAKKASPSKAEPGSSNPAPSGASTVAPSSAPPSSPNGASQGSDRNSEKKAEKGSENSVQSFGSCGRLFAGPLGSKGFISSDSKFYYQLYVSEKVGSLYRQVFEEVDLFSLQRQDLLALNIPLVDLVSYENKSNAEGVSFFTFDKNQDDCFSGPGTMISIPIKRNSISEKSEFKRDKATITSVVDFSSFWNFYDSKAGTLFEITYNPFLKRQVSFSVPEDQRLIFVGPGKIKRPYVALKRDLKNPEALPILSSYDINGSSIAQIKLAAEEKVLSDGFGSFGTMIFEKKGLNFEVRELQSLGSGNRDQSFRAVFPSGFLPSQANFLVNFKKRTLVGYPASSFFKGRWPNVLIFDYETGKEVGRIIMKNGIVGQVSLNRDATKLVAEEVDPTSHVRKSLQIYDLTTKKISIIQTSSLQKSN